MSGLFSKPKVPQPPAPPPIPEPDDEAVRMAERRARAARMAQSGQRSTIRQEAGGSLGTIMSSEKLGG